MKSARCARSLHAEALTAASRSIFPALRSQREHLDDVVMQAVVKITLQGPGELRVLDVPGVDRSVVGMQAEIAILQLNYQLDSAVVFTRGKIHQGVLITPQLGLHFLQMRHAFMLA